MKWKQNFRINSHYADPNGIVRPSAVLRYMQEAAEEQMYNCHPTNEELRSINRAFILSKFSMSIYEPLHKHDEIQVLTWPVATKGVTFPRCAQIIRNGVIVSEMTASWALIDIETKKLCRNGEIEFGYDYDEMLTLDVPQRIHIPVGTEMALVGEKTVCYSDIDVNMHMNNTNYPDMFCDFMPDILKSRVLKMTVSYLHEAPLGAKLKIYILHDEDSYIMRSVLPDGTFNSEALITPDII